jgi:hypothetical protein
MKGITHEKLHEALATWIGQLNVKNCTATDEVIREWAKIICKYCTLLVYQIFF